MIIEIRADVLSGVSNNVICPVNTVGAMGKGAALQFASEFPGLLNVYRGFCNRGGYSYPGSVLYIPNIFNAWRNMNFAVFMLPTKYHWKQSSSPELIRAGLEMLRQTLDQYEIPNIAMPLLGSGCGNLNWETEVRPMVYEILGGLRTEVYICHMPVHH